MKTVMQSHSTRLLLQEPRYSQIGLCWIIGTGKDWKPFVQNRVNEIRRLVPVEGWSHCSGKSNPADIPSRELSSAELPISELWKHGPSWLHDDFDAPVLPLEIPEACAKELKSSDSCCLIASTDSPVHLSTIVDSGRYSSIEFLKFISLLKGNDKPGQLTHSDLAQAQKLWISNCQMALTNDKNYGSHNLTCTWMSMVSGDVRVDYRTQS